MATVLTRNRPSPQKGGVSDESGKDEPLTSTASLPAELALGVPIQTKRFFWQKSKSYDPNAIATLPSVFDDPDTAEKYHPRSDWLAILQEIQYRGRCEANPDQGELPPFRSCREMDLGRRE